MKTTNFLATAALLLPAVLPAQQVLTGQAAFGDWDSQKPGVHRKITVADLPEPAPEQSVDNGPHLIPRPDGAWPIAPPGFKVTLYAGGDFRPTTRSSSVDGKPAAVPPASSIFREPRLMRTAPNGDIFLSDSHGDKVYVLRGVGPDGKAQQISTFASGLNLPFGINFYPAGPNPKWVYIGNTDSVVRFSYKSGDLVASGVPEKIVPQLPGFAQLRGGGHWTRDIVFSKDGTHMFVSVGSGSNVDDPDTHPNELHRADVLLYTPEGKFLKVYASGIRNCVGEAINPITGVLWCSVNERDNLGNHLVPDYVTSVPEDSFFGWPWFYMGTNGGHQDPRLMGTHPELKSRVLVPDVIVQPHMASLQMTFAPSHIDAPGALPGLYEGDAFAAEHGSWNRAQRAGYEVIRIPMHNGKADGSYEDFLTGFVTKDGQVWGRPVGITIGKDGSMFVTDDGSRSVWRITYEGNTKTAKK